MPVLGRWIEVVVIGYLIEVVFADVARTIFSLCVEMYGKVVDKILYLSKLKVR